MKKYRYKALDISRNMVKGVYNYSNVEEIIKDLNSKKLFLMDCKEISDDKLIIKRKFSLKETYLFCQQFYHLTKSGISIPESLRLMSLGFKDEFIRKKTWELFQLVSQGESLYSAMENLKKVYPSFVMAMIKIGEESGNLEQVFYRLSKHYYYSQELKNKIKKSLTYPLITLGISSVAMILLRMKAIPTFTNMVVEMGGTVPTSTKIFIFLFDKGFMLMGILIILLLLCFKIEGSYSEKIKFKIPCIAKYILRWEEIKFVKSLGILLSSGMNVIMSLQTIIESTDSSYIKGKYIIALDKIKKGGSIWKTLEGMDIFQGFTIAMISIAETSGDMEDGLNNVEKILEEEFKYKLDKVSQTIEPALIVFISIFIGMIIVAAIMPIINMTSSINI